MAGLSVMPDLVLMRVADFLCPEDTVRLAKTCRRFYSILPSFLVMKGEDFHVLGPGRNAPSRPPELYFDGPPLTSTVKRLNMSLVWKDQGWGNLKGEMYVTLMRPSEKETEEVAVKRRVFGIAKHSEEAAKSEITAEPILTLAQSGDFYRFMRIVGGGGGHSLTVKKFKAVATLTQTNH